MWRRARRGVVRVVIEARGRRRERLSRRRDVPPLKPDAAVVSREGGGEEGDRVERITRFCPMSCPSSKPKKTLVHRCQKKHVPESRWTRRVAACAPPVLRRTFVANLLQRLLRRGVQPGVLHHHEHLHRANSHVGRQHGLGEGSIPASTLWKKTSLAEWRKMKEGEKALFPPYTAASDTLPPARPPVSAPVATCHAP